MPGVRFAFGTYASLTPRARSSLGRAEGGVRRVAGVEGGVAASHPANERTARTATVRTATVIADDVGFHLFGCRHERVPTDCSIVKAGVR
jgi:hypothetical protein